MSSPDNTPAPDDPAPEAIDAEAVGTDRESERDLGTPVEDGAIEKGQGQFDRWVHPPLRQCCFLTGPTSSGKTELALEVAKRMNAEIISLDSMAVYKMMDIGTAKPTPEQCSAIPHHMLNVVDPTEAYSTATYVAAAHRCAQQIAGAGRTVLVCGGTPLYLKSLLRGLFLGPEADWDFRHSVEKDIEEFGQEALRDRVMQVDPLLAHKLHPHDHRRMIRGLEVARVTGKPLSHWQQQFDYPAPRHEAPVAVLQLERSWLHQRINQRVDDMIERGIEEETRAILKYYGHFGRTASQAVGYREMLDRIENGVGLDATIERIKAHTRQFARRQEIWFRGLEELHAIRVTPASTTQTLADEVTKFFLHSLEEKAGSNAE